LRVTTGGRLANPVRVSTQIVSPGGARDSEQHRDERNAHAFFYMHGATLVPGSLPLMSGTHRRAPNHTGK